MDCDDFAAEPRSGVGPIPAQAGAAAQGGGQDAWGVQTCAGERAHDVVRALPLRPQFACRRALVLASGGADSSTLLALAVDQLGPENVRALSVTYGQKHVREVESARAVAAHYGVPLEFLDLTGVFADSDSSLLARSGAEVPHETYADQLTSANGAPVSTYVPFRNGLFLSAAASVALSHDCDLLVYGAHHDDAAGNAYPDCSAEFVEAMAAAIELGSGGDLRMAAPFVTWTKADIIGHGLRLGVPYELTWSCYEGGETPCGVCGTCRDRLAAFAANGAVDPLVGEA